MVADHLRGAVIREHTAYVVCAIIVDGIDHIERVGLIFAVLRENGARLDVAVAKFQPDQASAVANAAVGEAIMVEVLKVFAGSAYAQRSTPVRMFFAGQVADFAGSEIVDIFRNRVVAGVVHRVYYHFSVREHFLQTV